MLGGKAMLQRSFDLLLSAAALLLLSPLFVVIALSVLFAADRPILFSQERVGRNGRRFRIWKFRSMTCNGEVTRIGRRLRNWKLDELPQLWNVLRGEMSLVGPRPELPVYVERYADRFRQILSVRPGITDPASLAFAHEEELLARAACPEQTYCTEILPGKLALSEGYLRERSVARDACLLYRTVVLVGKRFLAR